MTRGLLGGLGGSSGVGTVFNERLAAVQAATTPMGKLQALLQTIRNRFRTAGGTAPA